MPSTYTDSVSEELISFYDDVMGWDEEHNHFGIHFALQAQKKKFKYNKNELQVEACADVMQVLEDEYKKLREASSDSAIKVLKDELSALKKNKTTEGADLDVLIEKNKQDIQEHRALHHIEEPSFMTKVLAEEKPTSIFRRFVHFITPESWKVSARAEQEKYTSDVFRRKELEHEIIPKNQTTIDNQQDNLQKIEREYKIKKENLAHCRAIKNPLLTLGSLLAQMKNLCVPRNINPYSLPKKTTKEEDIFGEDPEAHIRLMF